MKKYRVTDKHPEIKEGIIFKRQNGNMCLSPSCFVHIPDGDISTLLSRGWIQEIREPEYNKEWIERMKLIDDILGMYNLDDIETLKKILERA